MPNYRVLIAREVSEYAMIEIEAKTGKAARQEAMRKLTEASDELDNVRWDIGNETINERVVYCEKEEENG